MLGNEASRLARAGLIQIPSSTLVVVALNLYFPAQVLLSMIIMSFSVVIACFFFSALTLVKYGAALCYFNSQSLRNLLREQINFKSLQCPVVVMLRCNVLTVLQWLLSASILGTGLWTTFSSNVPRRKVLLLFQMRENMLFRPGAAVRRPKKKNPQKSHSDVDQLASVPSSQIGIKQRPLEFRNKKKNTDFAASS